ncbi:Uncharacterised protein [Mycolicibacterium vanbaalenii]|uniref:Uncharacterized protein n=1 Tax=Mycolicibacterium vanbaalenii TaxID=110539 RepID=A0A5S9QZ83_MYCVN|nr:hypothetical protein [Mycolicibacterium vanbaalenii]CAA0124428.1 Uncharacterised protein [Mycolicibacterium vanbaalenii]
MASALELFESCAAPVAGRTCYPGDTVPYVQGQVDPSTPTDLGPTDKIPDLVVVR